MATFPDLAGKVAVVTGGSRGLGAATCRALARNGAKVAVNGRDTEAIDAVVAELRSMGAEALPAPADCTDATALSEVRDRVAAELGRVQILIAFAGGGRQPQSVLDVTEDEWRLDVERNLTATFLTVKTFLPPMMEGGGSIVTMASAAARQAGGAPIAYAAAKAGVISFTQQVAAEVGKHGVRVNCLAPSTVLNERMQAAIPAERQEQLAGMYPLGRLGVPDDVAEAALFLASDASSWITGITLDLAGGQVMR